MDGALKVLLPAALIVLVSGQLPENYRDLPYIYQNPINKAVEKANGIFGKNNHVDFQSLGNPRRTMKSSLYMNVFLMVTTCEKASNNLYEHRDECVTQKENTPVIDCIVCTTNDDTELVDCGTLREVKAGKRKTIREKCRNHFHGGVTLMGSSKIGAQSEEFSK